MRKLSVSLLLSLIAAPAWSQAFVFTDAASLQSNVSVVPEPATAAVGPARTDQSLTEILETLEAVRVLVMKGYTKPFFINNRTDYGGKYLNESAWTDFTDRMVREDETVTVVQDPNEPRVDWMAGLARLQERVPALKQKVSIDAAGNVSLKVGSRAEVVSELLAFSRLFHERLREAARRNKADQRLYWMADWGKRLQFRVGDIVFLDFVNRRYRFQQQFRLLDDGAFKALGLKQPL